MTREIILSWEKESFQQWVLLVLRIEIEFFCVNKEINRRDLSGYEKRIMLEEQLTGK